jgi:hypothetical protein
MGIDTLACWHDIVRSGDFARLPLLLADDCVFHSRTTDFKVMFRPLRAINLLHQKMAAALTSGDHPPL